MTSAAKQYVVRAEDGASFEVQGEKGDIVFPEQVRGWGDVLDARHTPFDDKELDELRLYAKRIHKFFILVYEEKLKATEVELPEG
jgi:hypothetical protein